MSFVVKNIEKKKNVIIALLLVIVVIAAVFIGFDQLKHKRNRQANSLMLQYRFTKNEQEKQNIAAQIHKLRTASFGSSASADAFGAWLADCQNLLEQTIGFDEQGLSQTSIMIYSDAEAMDCPWTWQY